MISIAPCVSQGVKNMPDPFPDQLLYKATQYGYSFSSLAAAIWHVAFCFTDIAFLQPISLTPERIFTKL